MRKIEIKTGPKLEDYQAYSSLRGTVDSFLETVPQYVEKLKGKTIWMINSTATGGGVAEMVPSQMRIMRAMGVSIEWMVIETDDVEFFNITKRIHNAIHGSGDGKFSESDRDPYERVNRHNLQQALDVIQDGDVVVIHDPQPMPLAGMLKNTGMSAASGGAISGWTNPMRLPGPYGVSCSPILAITTILCSACRSTYSPKFPGEPH